MLAIQVYFMKWQDLMKSLRLENGFHMNSLKTIANNMLIFIFISKQQKGTKFWFQPDTFGLISTSKSF